MHRRVIIAGMAAALLLLAAIAGQARVFQRLGGTGATLFRAEVVGRLVYETIMQVNGGEAAVTVASCDRSVAALRASLGAGGSTRYRAGDGFGVGRLEGGGRTASILALTPGREDRALVVAVEQSDAEHEQSRHPAQAEGATGIAGLPGSVLTCTLRNNDTRTALETRRAAVAPSAAVAYYDTTLRRSGWTNLLPKSLGDGGMMVYVKESDVCCVRVGPADSRGECLVTVVRKPGAEH